MSEEVQQWGEPPVQCEECRSSIARAMTLNGLCPECTDRRRCTCGHLLDQHKTKCTASAWSRLGFRLSCGCEHFASKQGATR